MNNDTARWVVADPTHWFWQVCDPAFAHPDTDYWILAPMRCPACGGSWFWWLPVTRRLPEEMVQSILETRRQILRERGWVCDACNRPKEAA